MKISRLSIIILVVLLSISANAQRYAEYAMKDADSWEYVYVVGELDFNKTYTLDGSYLIERYIDDEDGEYTKYFEYNEDASNVMGCPSFIWYSPAGFYVCAIIMERGDIMEILHFNPDNPNESAYDKNCTVYIREDQQDEGYNPIGHIGGNFGNVLGGSTGGISTGSSYGSSRSTQSSCSQCYGTGNCSICNGSGWMDLSYTGNRKPCTICNGKGKCTSCHGTGRR